MQNQRPKMINWCTAALMTAAGAAHADVLYDALYTNAHNDSTSDFISSSIGGLNLWGGNYDLQSADDFTLATDTAMTAITYDTFGFATTANGSVPSAVRVEFFQDVAGAPAAAASHSVTVNTFSSVQVLGSVGSNFNGGDSGSEPILRLGIDLSGESVVLGAGTWWVSMSAESGDNWYYNFGAWSGTFQGNRPQRRDGGLAHGNGYTGIWGSYNWAALGSGTADIAMRLEGVAVPAPATFAMLGLGALGAARRRR
ncbi:MAG: PEP-CTERM sorting domain-containing protein [Phycisphaerales bacterium]|jgi:hypothetical protein|nr:PEP-CTERM sorting domain-containing protein [Phycisphaerales bacterium]